MPLVYSRTSLVEIEGGTGGVVPAESCPDPGVGFATIVNADNACLLNADDNCITAKT